MARRIQQPIPEPDRDSRAVPLAAVVIAAADAHGIPLDELRWLMPDVEGHITQEIADRTARRLAEVAAGRAAWQCEHGHLDAPALAEQLGIDVRDLPTAERLGLVVELEWPPDLREPNEYRPRLWSGRYAAATTLTDDQRRQIAATVLLTREEAAERLAITPAQPRRSRRSGTI